MDARDIIAELAGLYVAHWEEHDTAMKVGGYVPMDDDYPVEVPLKLLRLSYEKAMGAQSHYSADDFKAELKRRERQAP